VLWTLYTWTGLGAYLLYLRALIAVFPAWAGVLLDTSGVTLTAGTLLGLGAVWLLIGVGGAWTYRRRARRLPVLTGTPPVD
jgi:hypothetical protein